MARITGIDVRHSRSCRSRLGTDLTSCNCRPSYQAHVWSARDSKRIRKTYPTLAAARAWRAEAVVALRKGELRTPSNITLHQAWDTWLLGAKEGSVRNRSGDRYKPSALRGYEQAMRDRILPDLGGVRLSEVRRADVQHLADGLLAKDLDPSTIRNALMPLRALFRRAVARGEVALNPTSGIELPAVRGRRDRIASPEEAEKLIGALESRDRALWATAFYAGLRRGELMALKIEDVDLAAGRIRVHRSWDVREGAVEPKSRAGKRTIPIPAVLRDYLDEHLLHLGHEAGLLFGRTTEAAFDPPTVDARAKSAWKRATMKAKEEERDETFDPITLHEARHTYASLMIAAGVNAKGLSTYMGHASVTITYDRYGHLMPGNEDEAALLLDAYLERANSAAREATLSPPLEG